MPTDSHGPGTALTRREMLAQTVDGLVSGVSAGGAERLRQLAATVPLELARLWRVWDAANKLLARPQSASSALSIFANALELFNVAFTQFTTTPTGTFQLSVTPAPAPEPTLALAAPFCLLAWRRR